VPDHADSSVARTSVTAPSRPDHHTASRHGSARLRLVAGVDGALREAGRTLEGGESRRRRQPCLPPPSRRAPAAGGRQGGRRAEEAAEQEGARPAAPVVSVHGSIVPVEPIRIVTLGDVLLDVIVRLEQPFARGDDVRAESTAGAGGQAANVAAWSSELGAQARCIARRSNDAAGELVARELAQRGVDLVGPVGTGATGIVVSLVEDGERSMASDRGVAAALGPEDIDPSWLECDVLHVSGYALLREPIAQAALLACRLARARGARVSVDVASWTELRRYGAAGFRELLDELEPDVLFATEAEWQLLGAAYLTAPTSVLKRGRRGCTVITPDRRLELAPIETVVVDPTGAGDALAAGFMLGGAVEEAARRGLEAAARCIARVGSLP